MISTLLAVVGARGGVGASTFALALAAAAGAVLLDLDGLGGGLDVVAGIDQVPGLRWSGLQLAGGRLDPAELIRVLPCAGAVPLLAADRAPGPGVREVEQVLDVLMGAAVVVDLPRHLGPVPAAVLARCDLLVVVVPASVEGAVAGHALAAAVPACVRAGVVVRGPGLSPPAVAAAVGRPLLGAFIDARAGGRAAAAIVAGLVAA